MVNTLRRNKLVNIFGLIIIGLLIALTYRATLVWLFQRYVAEDSYYSHGFIVPFVSIFFIYQQKDCLKRLKQQASLAGLCVVLFALLLHVLGTILYIFSLSGLSLYILLLGITLFLFGVERFRVIWFPLLFLIFMFPLPMAVIGLISFPMKIFAAKAGVFIVSMVGIPVHGEGFNITIPAGHLLVGNPCSGLRSLISFLALGSVFAYITPLSVGKKWLLLLSSIPIALLSNIIRVPILILVSHYWGLEAAAPDTLVHTGSGISVFVFGFFLLFLLARVLERSKK